jgi:hypothetical protein
MSDSFSPRCVKDEVRPFFEISVGVTGDCQLGTVVLAIRSWVGTGFSSGLLANANRFCAEKVLARL